MFEGGSRVDPKGKDGLASVCAGLMSEGTEKLDKLAFEEVLADIASSVTSGASDEQHFVSHEQPEEELRRHPGPVGRHPAATGHAPGRARSQPQAADRRAGADEGQRRRRWPGGCPARWSTAPTTLFGRFPTEASYGALTLDDCKKFLADYVKPQGAKLFVVGDITKDELTKELAPRLQGLDGAAPRRSRRSAGVPNRATGKIFFVDIPGAPQSVVQLMHLGPAAQGRPTSSRPAS